MEFRQLSISEDLELTADLEVTAVVGENALIQEVVDLYLVEVHVYFSKHYFRFSGQQIGSRRL